MKKIIENIHYSLYGIKVSLAGYTLHCHETDSSQKEYKNIPTFKDDKANLKSDADAAIMDFKEAVDEKMAECEVK